MLDELERVRAYKDDVPEPDTATVLAARAELMAAIAQEPRTAPGANDAEQPTPRNAGQKAPRATRLRRLQRRRRFVLAGGLATAGVAVAGALGFSTAAAPQSALAKEMNQLAQVAASRDWTGIPGPGQYLYTVSEGPTDTDAISNGQECSISQVDHRRSWIATNGAGAISETHDQSKFTSAADQTTCAAVGITNAGSQDSSSNLSFAPGGLTDPANTRNWKSFSTDPATLLKQVHERDGGPDTPAEWFVNIGDFMRESDVPPAIRAALYKAAALIPGVKPLGTQENPDPGEPSGLAVGFPYPGGQIHSELIFDQQTGRLLAEEYYDESGKLSDWTAYTEQKIVDHVPSYPMSPTAAGEGQATTSTPTSSSAP